MLKSSARILACGRLKTLAGAAVVAAGLLGPAAAYAEKLTIIVGGMEKQIYLPAALTNLLDYFKDEGLDVELINSRASVEAENELLADAVQGVVGFYDHTIDLHAKGKFTTSVVQFSQAPGEVQMVATKYADQIKSPADFKGRTLGVTGLGSSTISWAWTAARSPAWSGPPAAASPRPSTSSPASPSPAPAKCG